MKWVERREFLEQSAYIILTGYRSYEHIGHIALAIFGMKSSDGLFRQLELILGKSG